MPKKRNKANIIHRMIRINIISLFCDLVVGVSGLRTILVGVRELTDVGLPVIIFAVGEKAGNTKPETDTGSNVVVGVGVYVAVGEGVNVMV